MRCLLNELEIKVKLWVYFRPIFVHKQMTCGDVIIVTLTEKKQMTRGDVIIATSIALAALL
jgi:hypothetical protein